MTTIGILTGGGDAPGLNACIRGAVRKALSSGYNIMGIKRGWAGLIENDIKPLDINSVSGILPRGGTVLGSSRTNPFKIEGGVKKIKKTIDDRGIDAILATGGEDTLGVAAKLFEEGIAVVGVPKTIDRDLNATETTIGFDTATNIIMEAIDRIHTTAESHNRVMIVEVMGRNAGWLATVAGIVGGADGFLIPEVEPNLEELCESLKSRHARGKTFSIVIVAEGVEKFFPSMSEKTKEVDAFGHIQLGGIGQALAAEIEERTGYETRATVLGHIQRGGSPTAFDRLLATRLGVAAVEMISEGKFGMMASYQHNSIVPVPLTFAVERLKTVDLDLYELAQLFCY